MLRPGLLLAALLTGTVAWLAPAPAVGADDYSATEAATAQRFLQGLRERGYFDLAIEYLEQLRSAPGTPDDLKVTIDYEMGRCLLEQASHSADLERQRDLLEQARKRLESFAKANPKHRLVPEALVQMARLLVERGHVSMMQADEIKEAAEKTAKVTEARSSFQEARKAYAQVEPTLKTALDGFPKFIPDGDPRKQDRERALVALMDDRLQKALVDYEEAQTYAVGSKERNELLDHGIEAFKTVYQEHRTQLAGLYARMWQGKCYEEKGELGPAMGIYNELMDHPDPRLRPLQRRVGYFRIIVIGKRKEYALAVDEANRWLQSNPGTRRSEEGMGVMLELAKNIIAQVDSLKGAEHEAALKRATETLGEIVRYYSPHKAEALALLQKYRPKAALNATVAANLSYDDAMAQGDAAVSTQEWPRAIALFKAAIRRADPSREADHDKRIKLLDSLNRARQSLAFCYFQT
ncbi:MAG TPA: hypothetical protein VGZ22_12440, partial [Isosphaeraceae bacterium]|nr:hypothetical protein [Isosphaeraceae bacterium]